MSKIEPMSVDQIKTLLGPPHVLSLQTKQLILAWIHAEARARRYKWTCETWATAKFSERSNWTDTDWLDEVKAEVGWPSQSE